MRMPRSALKFAVSKQKQSSLKRSSGEFLSMAENSCILLCTRVRSLLFLSVLII